MHTLKKWHASLSPALRANLADNFAACADGPTLRAGDFAVRLAAYLRDERAMYPAVVFDDLSPGDQSALADLMETCCSQAGAESECGKAFAGLALVLLARSLDGLAESWRLSELCRDTAAPARREGKEA